jgi:hypothetical protein
MDVTNENYLAEAHNQLWIGLEPMPQQLWDALVAGLVTDGGMAEAGWFRTGRPVVR